MPLASPRMTADDYWARPEGVRAELIDGELWDLAASSQLHQVSHDRTPPRASAPSCVSHTETSMTR